jgi:hypothetical protein
MPDQVRHDELWVHHTSASSCTTVTPDLIRGPPSSGQKAAQKRSMPDQVRHDEWASTISDIFSFRRYEGAQ